MSFKFCVFENLTMCHHWQSLQEKEKELEVRNIYAQRVIKPPHKLNSSVNSVRSTPVSSQRSGPLSPGHEKKTTNKQRIERREVSKTYNNCLKNFFFRCKCAFCGKCVAWNYKQTKCFLCPFILSFVSLPSFRYGVFLKCLNVLVQFWNCWYFCFKISPSQLSFYKQPMGLLRDHTRYWDDSNCKFDMS